MTGGLAGRHVVLLGLAQLISWGTTFYIMGALGAAMIADLGWSPALVHGGFSAALVTMGLVSSLVGRRIDRHGGRRIMAAGAGLAALGCSGLSLVQEPIGYFAAWILLGLAMRMTLYDAAFASLARIAGSGARRAMSQITLLGGLASSVFWPLGSLLQEGLGWRGALLGYAGFALLAVPLFLSLPPATLRPAAPPAARGPVEARKTQLLRALLYALFVMLGTFVASGLTAHMLEILAALGTGAAVIWVAALPGIAQTSARLCELAFGRRLQATGLAVVASLLVAAGFLLAGSGFQALALGIGFALLYGAGNGLFTIARGTLPLALFDPSVYGGLVGRLIAPSFFLGALSPTAYALAIDAWGELAAVRIVAGLTLLSLLAAFGLRMSERRRPTP